MISRFGPAECTVCVGQECHGGGNLVCAQRDPRPSKIAAILDPYGGLRIVIEHEEALQYHVRCDEFLFVSERLNHIVHEPIAWCDIPMVCHIGDCLVADWIEQYGLGNYPAMRHALRLWQLRQLEHPDSRRSVHLPDMCET